VLHTPIGFTLAAFTPLCRFPIRSYAAVVAMRRVGASFSLGVAVHVVAWLVVPMPAAALQFEAGDGPFSVGIADFNGDDHSDLAVTNYWTNTVSILLSNGDGTFSTPTAFGTGAYPVAVAVGDLNGDGEFDLAVVNYAEGLWPSVSVLLGNGDGSFAEQVVYGTGQLPSSVWMAHLNKDDALDLCVPSADWSTISVLLGNGDGSFEPHMEYTPSFEPFVAGAADWNEDGALDLIMGQFGSKFRVLFGRGDGTFDQYVEHFAGGNNIDVAIADLNEDGHLDLVLANAGIGDTTITVVLGRGDGGFGFTISYPTGTRPTAVAIGDLNEDGDLDLVAANFESNTASVLLGHGDGSFDPHVEYATGVAPFDVAIGDLNGDGHADLALPNSMTATVSVLCGNGDGTFDTVSDVDPAPTIASELQLSVSPNPSRSASHVSFVLPSTGNVEIEIFDVSGRRVFRFDPQQYEAGPHALIWDGNDQAGSTVPAGLYLVRLITDGERATAPIVRINL
jgi:hypothetical protein